MSHPERDGNFTAGVVSKPVIQHGDFQGFAFDELQRSSHGASRADDLAACLFEIVFDLNSQYRFVLDDEHAFPREG